MIIHIPPPVLLLFHLPEKTHCSQCQCPCSVQENRKDMRKSQRVIRAEKRLFHFNSMHKRESIGCFFKNAAYQLQIKPYA